MIEIDGKTFRDLDHDGVLAPYEDHRLTPAARAADLVARMTLDEKIGLMLHGTIPGTDPRMGVLGIGAAYDLAKARDFIAGAHINSMITRLSLPPAELAAQNNAIQKLAAETRLGIPMTISTDPRHHFNPVMGASVASGGFTQWPGPLGLAAIGARDLMQRFADIMRQEYRATGIHMALSPQADLATSPRWARTDGTFGEDPALVRLLTGAYVEGVQGGKTGLTSRSVAAIVKHWVGYGASRDGFDGHNYYGRFSAFTGGAFQDHVDAFLDAFDAAVAGVMPTYNILDGLRLDGELIEQVGAGYSKELLTDLLRGTYGYKGVILSDWAIARDINDACRTGTPRMKPDDISMAWGVDHLPPAERFAKGINAGLDQFGGEDDPAPLKQAVRLGLLSEARIDQSALRILIQKFELGLFDNPFVSEAEAAALVGNAAFTAEAEAAQRRALVVIEKPQAALTKSDRVFMHNFSPASVTAAGLTVTTNLADATVALIRLSTPHEVLHPTFFFGSFQQEGDLDFKDGHEGYETLKSVAAKVPVIIVASMSRPAILTNIVAHASGIIAEFGASDAAILDVLTGRAEAQGRLPLNLPASMEAVLTRSPDKPHDGTPLYAFGHRAG